MKEKYEYQATANLTRDHNIDMDYHPTLGELNDIHQQVLVWFTADEWHKYQLMKWLTKSNHLRNKALIQIQINKTKDQVDDTLDSEYWFEWTF